MKLKTRLFLLSIFIYGVAFAQESTYSIILQNIKDKNFFEAEKIYRTSEKDLDDFEKLFLDAYIENAFNRLEVSKEKIENLLKNYGHLLSNQNKIDLYRLQHENALKLFDYKLGKKSLEIILTEFKDEVTEDDLADFQNSMVILKALEYEAPQKVIIPNSVKIKMKKDQVGLKNLPVHTSKDSIDFIFDTGANLSTTTKSTAEKLGMKILDGKIEVGAITGKKVMADLAVCKEFKIKDLTLQNVVFIVLEDSELAFPQIDYQIHGILGFPVIEALREIQITKDDYFIVPKNKTKFEGNSNLALNNLQPLIWLDNMIFTLDSGATQTTLYHKYFKENQSRIETNYPKTKVNLGGAGGAQTFEAYKIDLNLKVNQKEINLKEIPVLLGDEEDNWRWFHGNLGQDVIQEFEKMTLNFHQMFISFD